MNSIFEGCVLYNLGVIICGLCGIKYRDLIIKNFFKGSGGFGGTFSFFKMGKCKW